MVFVLGYAGIIFEARVCVIAQRPCPLVHIKNSSKLPNELQALTSLSCSSRKLAQEYFSFNKSGVALLTAVAMWTVRAAASSSEAELNASLSESLAEVGQIVFFLLGAMTVVETVDAHAGFKIVTDAIGKRDNRTLLWLVGVITFFLSAILDNLTSTIVMVSLLRKLVPVAEQRKLLGAVVVIAANAGGAWTPIGDVTTTMLWISGQISALATMQDVFLPAATSLLVPLAMLSAAPEFAASSLPGGPATSNQLVVSDGGADAPVEEAMAPRATLVLTAGLASLIFVPIFKSATGLPPYLGMLAGLGALWVLTDAIHYGEPDRQQLKVPEALGRIDLQGILFFLGILMAISSLDSAGVLRQLAGALDSVAPNVESVALAIGLVSAVIDNVPLVAATQGMYDMAAYPQDCALWQLIAFCAGTGGSILIIGSAAGVAFMGLERASFEWYAKKVTPLALGGYLAGTAVYVGTHALFPHAS